jgi:DNA-binding MarR family transcriptional regulator
MSMTTPATTFLPGPPKELLDSTTFLLKRLGMAVKDRSADAFASTGISGQHYAVLLTLEEGVRETQGAIADALGYDRSVLVGMLDELEELGFVERRRDPADRRRHMVTLTGEGQAAVRKLRAMSAGVEESFLAPLDAGERQELHGLLLKLVSHHDIRCAASLKR